jgi:hypothetical protein
MFQPGGTATLATIRALQSARKSLYIKGVVSTPPSDGDSTDESEVSQRRITHYDRPFSRMGAALLK